MNAAEIFKKAYISYSRLSSYDKCPRKFKYAYLDGHPTTSGRAAQVGKLVHEVIADYLRVKSALGGTIQTDVADIVSGLTRVADRMKEEKEIDMDISANDMDVFFRGFCALYPRINTDMIAGIEIEKNFDINGYTCKGVVDLVLQDENGKINIIDYKTGRPGYVDDLQLILYSMPYIEEYPGQAIAGAFAFLREPSIRRVDISPSMANNSRDIVVGRVEEIEADERFERKRSRLCDFCEFRRLCDGDSN